MIENHAVSGKIASAVDAETEQRKSVFLRNCQAGSHEEETDNA